MSSVFLVQLREIDGRILLGAFRARTRAVHFKNEWNQKTRDERKASGHTLYDAPRAEVYCIEVDDTV